MTRVLAVDVSKSGCRAALVVDGVRVASTRRPSPAVLSDPDGPAALAATVLQHHPHVTVLLDGAAASRLELTDHYRATYAAKPAWQGL